MTQATIPMIDSPTPVGRPMMRDKFCCTGSRVVGGAVGVAVGNRTVEGEEILKTSSTCHLKTSSTCMWSLPQDPPSRNNNKNSLAYPVIFVGFAWHKRLSLVPRPLPDFILQP